MSECHHGSRCIIYILLYGKLHLAEVVCQLIHSGVIHSMGELGIQNKKDKKNERDVRRDLRSVIF